MAFVSELSSSGNTAAKSEKRVCDILFCGSLSRKSYVYFVTEIVSVKY
jgi:hypothetical protein